MRNIEKVDGLMNSEFCMTSMFLELEGDHQRIECLKLRSRWDAGIGNNKARVLHGNG